MLRITQKLYHKLLKTQACFMQYPLTLRHISASLGCQLLDATGRTIALFPDYKDAQEIISMSHELCTAEDAAERVAGLETEIESLNERIGALAQAGFSPSSQHQPHAA